MPEYKLGADGQLVDEEGHPVLIGEEPILVMNARTQEQVDQEIGEHVGKLNDRIKALEAQANKAPELEKLLEDLKIERDKAQQDLRKAREQAEQEVASQLSTLKKQTEDLGRALGEERQLRVRDQVTSLILSAAGDRFINPAKDVVPDLLRVHRREPVKGEDGRPVEGQFIDLFRIEYRSEKGETVNETAPVSRAIELLAGREDYQHYIKGATAGGSGGGQYASGYSATRLADLHTDAEKAAFVEKHGIQAFKDLAAKG